MTVCVTEGALCSSVETKSCTFAKEPKSTFPCQLLNTMITTIHEIMLPQLPIVAVFLWCTTTNSGGVLMNFSENRKQLRYYTCQEESLDDTISGHFLSQLRQIVL